MALHQREWLVLHAAAVLHDGAVSIFVGDSGAGKSTLAASFGKAGYDVLADDAVAVRMNGSSKPEIWPGARSFKLWADTLDSLGLKREELAQVANRTDKYFVLNARPIVDAAYPLAEIIVLDTVEEGQKASLETLPKLEAIRVIAANTYRPEFVDLLDRRADHFQQCVALAASIPVRRFRRPWDRTRMGAGVELLERLGR
jgi:ABC-type cobalamin/Fe3+-siderophores transport system ATPase subunit